MRLNLIFIGVALLINSTNITSCPPLTLAKSIQFQQNALIIAFLSDKAAVATMQKLAHLAFGAAGFQALEFLMHQKLSSSYLSCPEVKNDPKVLAFIQAWAPKPINQKNHLAPLHDYLLYSAGYCYDIHDEKTFQNLCVHTGIMRCYIANLYRKLYELSHNFDGVNLPKSLLTQTTQCMDEVVRDCLEKVFSLKTDVDASLEHCRNYELTLSGRLKYDPSLEKFLTDHLSNRINGEKD